MTTLRSEAPPGYGIITTAALKPFCALTERESEVLEDKGDVRKPDPVLAQAAAEAHALGQLGVQAGTCTGADDAVTEFLRAA